VSRVRIVATGAAAVGVAGALMGGVVALSSAGSHRAVTTLAVQRGGAPADVPSIVALAKTSVLAENVAQAAHVPAATVERHLHARALHGTALLELAYDDPSSARAAQLAQQAASTLQSLVASRFPALSVAVVDPAHPEPGTRRPVLRDLLIGALAGAFVGALVGLGLAGREAVRDTTVSDTVPPVPPPAPARQPGPEPDPESVPSAELAQLRAALAAHGDEFRPDQVTEWAAFLDALEPHVVDGELPSAVAQVADEVFAPLRERMNRTAD
jgi:hypothetical protein